MSENKNFTFTVTLIALSRSIDMEFTSTDAAPLNEVMAAFLLLFAGEVDLENGKIALDQPQISTEKLRENFKKFVDEYKADEPKLNQLNDYFKDLEADERFFLVVNAKVDQDSHIELSNMLTAIKHGEDYEKLKDQIDELFKELRAIYEIQSFDKRTKKTIGERDKEKRICRFCGKSKPDVTFKSVAHAVSEALGNKGIVLNEECDTCNSKFGSQLEIHLIEYLRFFCVLFGIKGKEKIPEIKSPEPSKFPLNDTDKNFGMKIDDKGVKIEYFQSEREPADTRKSGLPLRYDLRTDKDVIDQNIYKTFCKYALSVIDSKYLPAFSETIKWINGDIHKDKLPKVAMLVTNSFYDPHPRLTLYIRKIESDSLPHLVGELNFTAYTFSFIVPFSIQDKVDFLTKESYMKYWKFFKHYEKIKGWRFIDFSNNASRKLVVKLNLLPAEKSGGDKKSK